MLMERDVFFRLACLGVCLPEALLCRERPLFCTPGGILSHAHFLLDTGRRWGVEMTRATAPWLTTSSKFTLNNLLYKLNCC